MQIKKEQIFTVPATHFAIGGSSSGYVLQYSADGDTFTDWDESTNPNETLVVANVAKNMQFKLAGNTDDNVYVQY